MAHKDQLCICAGSQGTSDLPPWPCLGEDGRKPADFLCTHSKEHKASHGRCRFSDRGIDQMTLHWGCRCIRLE